MPRHALLTGSITGLRAHVPKPSSLFGTITATLILTLAPITLGDAPERSGVDIRPETDGERSGPCAHLLGDATPEQLEGYARDQESWRRHNPPRLPDVVWCLNGPDAFDPDAHATLTRRMGSTVARHTAWLARRLDELAQEFPDEAQREEHWRKLNVVSHHWMMERLSDPGAPSASLAPREDRSGRDRLKLLNRTSSSRRFDTHFAVCDEVEDDEAQHDVSHGR